MSLTTQALTTDYVRPDPPRLIEAIHSVTIPEATRIALLQLSILDGSNPFSPFTILLAAFVVLSFRLTGDEDISLGTSSENKEPFVLRTPVDGQTTFQSMLTKVKEVISPITRVYPLCLTISPARERRRCRLCAILGPSTASTNKI